MINSINASSTILQNANGSTPTSRLDEMFAQADANSDGKIDKAEFAAMKLPQGPNTANTALSSDELFAKMDTDGDGMITKSEMTAFHKSHHHPQAKSADANQLFAKMDSNGDGSVTKDEFELFLFQLEEQQKAGAASTYTQTGTAEPVSLETTLNVVG